MLKRAAVVGIVGLVLVVAIQVSRGNDLAPVEKKIGSQTTTQR